MAGAITMAGTAATIGTIVTTGTAVITGNDLRFCRRAFLPRIGKNTAS
jgi:hypothetical protein